MTELSLLAIYRLMNACYEPVTGRGLVTADLATVRAVVGHPGMYDGVARVLSSNSARVIVVRVHVTPRTVVRYTWMLSPNRGTTELYLEVGLQSRGPRYRLALLLGGARWLHRQMEATLARVSHVTVCAAEDMDAAHTTQALLASAQ
jgi:hypothetical protein